jgi:hypothetical protein
MSRSLCRFKFTCDRLGLNLEAHVVNGRTVRGEHSR